MFTAILGLLGGKKSFLYIGIGIVVISAGTWAYSKYNAHMKYVASVETKVTDLQKEKEDLIAQREQLREQKQQLLQVDKENQEFIAQLKKDQEDKDILLRDLRIQKARDNKKLDAFAKKIASYSEADNGPVAKVLKDTVAEIINRRENAAIVDEPQPKEAVK